MLRILAGEYKGRRLIGPPAHGATRPITGLAKKSLFGMLSPRLPGAVAVDLYCGTGTLGLEALSQGARACYFAERDWAAISRLRRNIEALGLTGRCTIWAGDVSANLAARLDGLEAAIDVAFVDPPFAEARGWSWAEAAERIFQPLGRRMAPDGVAAIRVPTDVQVPDPLGGLAVRRRREHGDMALILLGPAEGL